MANRTKIPFPRGVRRLLNQALLAAEALHRAALQSVRAAIENAVDPTARLLAENDRLKELLTVRDQELRILKARLEALPPRERPHYPPHERFAILSLRAQTGWTVAEVARRFLVTATTIAGWIRRLDELGKNALVKPRVPVNRHSDRFAMLVQKLHTEAPCLGKRKVADMLARAGLILAASTVRRLRMRKIAAPPSTPPPKAAKKSPPTPVRVVTAKHPHHLWHVDITAVPTASGLSLPWMPFALTLLWPFAWRIAFVVDHFSRAVVAFAVFKRTSSPRRPRAAGRGDTQPPRAARARSASAGVGGLGSRGEPLVG